ncbi:MAG: efflux RND transporter periplasmic adaptor subunit [Deltaproteobacteria bacterium]|jgi:Cu(I)/Ag(I) efflux system membrane fusion protein|nr:efflux RND transporter periplasmic adaptor subunit [Deltaproteobacteria bacterium]
MSAKTFAFLLIGLVVGAAGARGWPLLAPTPAGDAASPAPAAGSESSPDGREVLYWYDPMYPGTRFDEPGKSPFMDMDLTPRYRDSSEGGGLAVDPVQVQNLGLKTAAAEKGALSLVRDVPANVEFNRYQEARIQPRAEGFVTEVSPLAVGDAVEAGSELARITVPGWASDQSEYLLLKSQRADARLIGGVREKLRLSGMPEEMLALVDKTGSVQTSLSLSTPIAGVVTSLDVYPGMNVDKNMTLAVVQGLDPVWVTAEVPQSDLSLALDGRPRVTTPAWPGRVFPTGGRTVLAQANQESRTVTLRLTVPNPDGALRPGLTAQVRLRGQGPEGLLIPTQSLIDLGDEQRVVTRLEDGSFLPKLVEVAGSSKGVTVVTGGLAEGETVVVSGLFLIDSEANLAGALERMRRPDGPPASETAAAAPEAGHDHDASAPSAEPSSSSAPAEGGRSARADG